MDLQKTFDSPKRKLILCFFSLERYICKRNIPQNFSKSLSSKLLIYLLNIFRKNTEKLHKSFKNIEKPFGIIWTPFEKTYSKPLWNFGNLQCNIFNIFSKYFHFSLNIYTIFECPLFRFLQILLGCLNKPFPGFFFFKLSDIFEMFETNFETPLKKKNKKYYEEIRENILPKTGSTQNLQIGQCL